MRVKVKELTEKKKDHHKPNQIRIVRYVLDANGLVETTDTIHTQNSIDYYL